MTSSRLAASCRDNNTSTNSMSLFARSWIMCPPTSNSCSLKSTSPRRTFVVGKDSATLKINQLTHTHTHTHTHMHELLFYCCSCVGGNHPYRSTRPGERALHEILPASQRAPLRGYCRSSSLRRERWWSCHTTSVQRPLLLDWRSATSSFVQLYSQTYHLLNMRFVVTPSLWIRTSIHICRRVSCSFPAPRKETKINVNRQGGGWTTSPPT